jgi:hypothetical protein
MVRHNPRVRSALALVLALSVGCGAAEPAEAPGRVEGLIVEIERDDAGEIRAFTVETRDEQRYEVAVDPGRDYGFDLEHLEVHREQALPVLVRLEERGDVLLAVEILDA